MQKSTTNQSGYGINKCKKPVKPSDVDNSRETEPSLITIFLDPNHRKAGQKCSICCQFWRPNHALADTLVGPIAD